MGPRAKGASACACFVLLATLAACASIPQHQYGVDTLRFEGMHDLDPAALRACLATRQRDKVTLGLASLRNPTCGEPPFDATRRSKRLFAFRWTDWPLYDEAVLKLDLDRITRWYQARGYYGARILSVEYAPESASRSDRRPEGEKDASLELTIHIEEGEPVRVRNLHLEGQEGLAPALVAELEKALRLKPGDVFDEAMYDQTREALVRVLREAGHARAQVDGDVVIERAALAADVKVVLNPGPVCQVGEVRIASSVPVPTGPIRAATLLTPGSTYRESDLDDAQRAVYALGAFASVTVRGDLSKPGDRIDIIIEVEPRRASQVSLGIGVMSGVLTTGPVVDETVSVPQWDVHLIGSYEHRNFLGGLRRFRVEDRPRLLFLGPFPSVPSHAFGNTLTVGFTQPGMFEPRTTLFVDARYDVGPDPFQLFFRHDVGVAVGLERGFFKQRLQLRGAVHQDVMHVFRRRAQPDFVTDNALDLFPCPERPDAPDDAAPRACFPKSYLLPFLDQRVTLDLRDNNSNPTRGFYFRLAVQEAARLIDPSWNYVRVAPDVRGYAPLGLGMVLAARFALASLHVFSASERLDEDAQRLGPQAYRLRGGGAQSNRGFLPGRLGAGITGGVRRWEGSLEWRIPLADSFGVVMFGDFGDVNADTKFRFSHLNTSVGAGLRYRTIIGPIRLDVAGRPDKLQRLDGSEPSDARMNLGFTKFRGAIHLTIGEAF